MAYQNINFPTFRLVHGFRLEKILPTTVVSNFSKEYRINRYSAERTRFVFPARNIVEADWVTLSNFINTVGHKRDSFNFTPPGGSPVKVRFDSIPERTIVALNGSNSTTMVGISEFSLITVLNE